ncbi:MAG: putative HTH-type transcriptional regulator YusO [bacterium ADurb.Bin429]|nr:MAG: putative HTH-type transcriptional regulator YusO [bacterium ADurb.Bin429]
MTEASRKNGRAYAASGQLERFVELLGAYSASVLTARLLEAVTRGEVTPAQFEALTFIHRHGGCSAKALSEGLRISIPSSTRLVDRLVRKALVDRRESAEDRRLVDLSLTEKGRKVLKDVRAARIARLQHALAALNTDEQTHLHDLLERFLRGVLCDEETVNDCCLHCGTEHDRDCVVNAVHEALVGRPITCP